MPCTQVFTHALGIITPSGNLVVERMTTALLREFPTVSAHFSRIPVVGDNDPFPHSYDTEGMLTAARLLSHAKPDAIIWSGSKGGKIGFSHDFDLKRRIEDATGIPTTTSSLALIDALAGLGARSVALVTPYDMAYQQHILATFAREGIEVSGDSHLGLTDNLSYAGVPPERILMQIAEMAPYRPDVVLTWCTNYVAACVAADAEAAHGMTVMDATTLPLWHALAQLGVSTASATTRWGKLFALAPGASGLHPPERRDLNAGGARH